MRLGDGIAAEAEIEVRVGNSVSGGQPDQRGAEQAANHESDCYSREMPGGKTEQPRGPTGFHR